MIAFSDNTATNLVLDAIGIGATAATMEKMGYPNTKIHSKVFRRDTSVFPERSKQVRPGQHDGRRDDPALRGGLSQADRQPVGLRRDARAPARLRRPRQAPQAAPARDQGRVQDRQPGRHPDRRRDHRMSRRARSPSACSATTTRTSAGYPTTPATSCCAEVARAVYDHFDRPAAGDAKAKKTADHRP